MRSKHVFASYCRRNAGIVAPLCGLLRVGGTNVFRDADGLTPGEYWEVVLTDKLEGSKKVLVFWTLEASQSKPVEEEWTRALQLGIEVVPVILDDTPLPEPLGTIQWLDLRQAIHGDAEELKCSFASAIFGPAFRLSDVILSQTTRMLGFGAEYLKAFMAKFRTALDKRLETIPEERMVEPPLRLGCAVLREAAYAMDESDLHDMFICLMAMSCDSETQHTAHPGFASVIGQMVGLDADILIKFDESNSHGVENLHLIFNPHREGEKMRQFSASICNLMRLGLLEWVTKAISGQQTYGIRTGQGSRRLVGHSTDGKEADSILQTQVNTLFQNLQQFSVSVSRLLANIGERNELRITEFGRQFLSACLRPMADAPESTQPTSPSPVS